MSRTKKLAPCGVEQAGGIDKFLAAIAVPAGFTAERYEEPRGWSGKESWPALKLTGDGVTIRIVITDPDLRDSWSVGTGHTEFTTAKGTYSYDRHGVEDSFYVNRADLPADMDKTIADQLAKVAKSREAAERSERVPGLPGGWSISPERKIEIAAKLRANRSHSFMPSGFGTGYCVSQRRDLFSTALPAETAKFFGVPQLYYTTLDCD